MNGAAHPEGQIDGDFPPLIPPGEYQLRVDGWQTRILFGRQPKVVLFLRVCDFGPFLETKLERWYNVRRLTGPPKASGRFVAGWSCDLVREYITNVGLVERTDRIALSNYRDLLLTGEVITVKSDRNQRPLPLALQYSIVRQLTLART